jgi:nucleotide-binding universal stress UspA family protein
MSKIVVGVDGSAGSRRALRWAIEQASRTGDSVEAVGVWHVPYAAGAYGVPAMDPGVFEQAAAEAVDRSVAEALDHSEVVVEQTVMNGSPAGCLLDAAKGADLLVVGQRGLGGIAGLLLGSVSHAVTHHAPCPVVVIPEDPDPA